MTAVSSTAQDSVLLVDDHPAFSQGLSSILESLMQNTHIYKASCAGEALEILEQQPHMDWVFLDYELPDKNGITLLENFNQNRLSASVILMSGNDNVELIDCAISTGASAYLSKSASMQEISSCIDTVSHGKTFLQSQFVEMLAQYRENLHGIKKNIIEKISPRQKEVLVLLIEGYSNLEIANSLSISQSTVKAHVSALISMFNADNRCHCAAEARRLKVVI